MTSDRKTAIVAGILFILAAVTAIVGALLYSSILNDPAYITKGSVNETRILWGAFLEIVLAFAVIGTSITLFPILKKFNESLALGTICFRLLEATLIVIGILSLLAILTLSHDYSREINPDTSSYMRGARLLLTIHNWTFLFGPNIALGPSTTMTGWWLYKSGLVPRTIAVLGLAGGPVIFVCGLMVMFGLFPQISVWGGVLAIPVFTYEMSLSVWLIVKGFRPFT